MKLKRILGLLLAVCMLGAFLAACAPEVEAPPEPPAPTPAPAPEPPPTQEAETPAEPEAPAEPEPDPVTLQWAVWDIELVMYYAPLIAAYREVAPHVTIEMVDLGAAEFEMILQTQLIGGTEYDLIKIRDVPSYAMHVNANLLTPLNDLLGNTDIDLANYAGIPEQFMIDGELFSLPIRSDFWVLYYNKDLFDEAGMDYPTNELTFDDWAQLIRDVSSELPDDVYGNYFHGWASTVSLFGILDGQRTVMDGPFDWMAHYYETVLALEDEGHIIPLPDIRIGSLHHSQLWPAQQIAMVNMGSWFAPTLAAEPESGNWGIAAYPVPGSAHFGNTLGQVTQMAIPRTANHPEEAMAFMAFVAGEQGAAIMASVGQFPAFMTDEALDTILASPGFPTDDTTRNAMRPRNIFLEQPIHELAAEFNTLRNEAHEEIMFRNMTVAEGIEFMNTEIWQNLLGN